MVRVWVVFKPKVLKEKERKVKLQFGLVIFLFNVYIKKKILSFQNN